MNISVSNVLSVKRHRSGRKIFPVTLNILSMGANDAGIHEYFWTSLAMQANSSASWHGFSKNQEGSPLASSMAETDTSLVLIQRQRRYWKLKFMNPSTDNQKK